MAICASKHRLIPFFNRTINEEYNYGTYHGNKRGVKKTNHLILSNIIQSKASFPQINIDI